MRAWISRQASGPASRPGQGSYDSALGRYYSAFPEGLRTRKGSDTRVTPYILWEEIPAWIQPGLPASLRDRPGRRRTRPAPGRTRTAPARPSAGAADPASQADDPAAPAAARGHRRRLGRHRRRAAALARRPGPRPHPVPGHRRRSAAPARQPRQDRQARPTVTPAPRPRAEPESRPAATAQPAAAAPPGRTTGRRRATCDGHRPAARSRPGRHQPRNPARPGTGTYGAAAARSHPGPAHR